MGDLVRNYSIAIVGAGPAGYFAAQALQNLESEEFEFSIDIFERLPTPWGLVRSGVAPDHPKIKTVSKVFEKVATHPKARLLANVEVGRDITLQELEENYDAVVIAIGTPRGRKLGIPGESLKNVISSADFVFWYNGHPDYRSVAVDLSGTHAIVIGAGNVAMDVGRMLAIDPKELDTTDTANHALEVLHGSNIRDVTIMARRGAEHAAFTSPELRELPDLESTRVIFEESEIVGALERAGIDPEKHVKSNLDAMLAISEGIQRDVDRSLRFHFEYRPIEIKGSDRVQSVVFETPNGVIELPCDLLVSAIGYGPLEIEDLEIDGNQYRNENGHIRDHIYVVGWAKRGPSGVIGTNKSDASDVMKSLIASLGDPKPKFDVVPLLLERGIKIVYQEGWSKINELEVNRGVAEGRTRVKITDVDEMVGVTEG
jgi:ferredoxin--NADP+ reductase